jgi:hypothetical protein
VPSEVSSYSHVEWDISFAHDNTVIVTLESTTSGTLITRDDFNRVDVSSAIGQLPQLFDRLEKDDRVMMEGGRSM